MAVNTTANLTVINASIPVNATPIEALANQSGAVVVQNATAAKAGQVVVVAGPDPLTMVAIFLVGAIAGLLFGRLTMRGVGVPIRGDAIIRVIDVAAGLSAFFPARAAGFGVFTPLTRDRRNTLGVSMVFVSDVSKTYYHPTGRPVITAIRIGPVAFAVPSVDAVHNRIPITLSMRESVTCNPFTDEACFVSALKEGLVRLARGDVKIPLGPEMAIAVQMEYPEAERRVQSYFADAINELTETNIVTMRYIQEMARRLEKPGTDVMKVFTVVIMVVIISLILMFALPLIQNLIGGILG